MSPWLFNVNMGVVVKEVIIEMGRRGESGDWLASFMHMTWFCVVSRGKT